MNEITLKAWIKFDAQFRAISHNRGEKSKSVVNMGHPIKSSYIVLKQYRETEQTSAQ